MKNAMNRISIIFKISLLIYPITFVIAVFLGTVYGIDSGWAMPAWSDGELMYGWDAIWSYLILVVWRFAIVYAFVLIFQVSYIIGALVAKIRK